MFHIFNFTKQILSRSVINSTLFSCPEFGNSVDSGESGDSFLNAHPWALFAEIAKSVSFEVGDPKSSL